MDNNLNGFISIPVQNGIQTTCGCNNTNNTPIIENAINGGTLQRNLVNYLGRRVTCDFENGGNTCRKTGNLSTVGSYFHTLSNVNG